VGFYPYKATTGGGSNPAVLLPSGDTTGATDLANINAGLANGGAVQLAPAPLSAPYYINAPITPTSQSRLWGAQWWSASENDIYGPGVGASGGTVIQATFGFTGAAAINMTNATNTQYFGVDLAGFTLELFSIPNANGPIHGILIDGAWGAGFIRGVCIHGAPGDLLHMIPDPTSGFTPDDWLISECKFSEAENIVSYGRGVYASFVNDSWFVSCESSENSSDGWYIAHSTNVRMVGCKGENNTGAGFHFGGNGIGGGTLDLIGCSTNLNQQDGFLFDDTASGGASIYFVDGCRASNDGQAGGTTYAGFRSAGCKSQVVLTGGGTQTGGSPSGPAYGASLISSAKGMTLTGVLLNGVTAATRDDGSNMTPLMNVAPAGTQSIGTGIAPGVVTLADAATILVNAAAGNDLRVTLGGNRAMGAPSNPVDGQDITFLITQDGTGSRTITWNSAYDFGAGSAPVLTTTAGKSDLIGFKYVAALTKWIFMGAMAGTTGGF
jgi:hypothetical protein